MNQKFTAKEKALQNQLLTGGLVLGILITVYILTSVAMAVETVPEGYTKFQYIHSQSPALYIAWVLPFILGIVTKYFATVFMSKKKEYDHNMEEKNQIITNNALFAKSIGEGDFDNTDIGNLNTQDLLTRSLMKMRDNLRKNKDGEITKQWINIGKEKVSNALRIHSDLEQLSYEVLTTIIEYCHLVQGRFYLWNDTTQSFELTAAYAYNRRKHLMHSFKTGEGMMGAAAFEKESIYRTEIPEDYFTITSGILGDKKPGSLLILPMVMEEKVHAVLEVGVIQNHIDSQVLHLLEELAPIIAQVIFTVSVNQHTEELLHEAQTLAEELKENEEELHQNAEEMRATQEELEKINYQLEHKINEVEDSKTRLHSLLQNAGELITVFAADGNILYESPSIERILGFTPEEVINSTATNRTPEEYRPVIETNFQKLINEPGQSVQFTFQNYKKDGTEIWLEATGRNMLNHPAIQGLIFNTRDITLQRLAEKDRRMKTQMQNLSENSPDLIIRFSRNGMFHYVNPKVKDYLGFIPSDLINKTLEEVEIDHELKSFLNQCITETLKTPKKSETEFSMKIGTDLKYFKISAIPEFNEEKKLETILIVAHDITDIKDYENEITEKNQKVTESIHYSQRIQQAILPQQSILNQHFSQSFIYYQARDVVSGDFPWFKVNDQGVYLAAVDCTGHGVPGAMLSFVGHFVLNNVVTAYPNAKAAELLDYFNQEVIFSLNQDHGQSNTRDGMDIAFCQFNPQLNKLYYSGAHRPLLFMRNGQLEVYKGDRRAIGGNHNLYKDKKFTQFELDLEKGDRIFIFSDGITDQFKEGSFEKFQEKQLRQIISENSKLNMNQLHQLIQSKVNEWKGTYRQIDDILLIGIEI